MKNNIIYFLVTSLFLISCEEEITLELPDTKAKVIVEGYIQPNYPIVVQLTSSKGYFDPITENELLDVFLSDVTDIKVIRKSDKTERLLTFVQLDSLGQVGVYSDLESFSADFAQFGERYTLEIVYNGDTIRSTTNIPFIETEEEPIVDSLWFVEDEEFPGYGDFYMSYNDNDTMGNNIMIESKRILSPLGAEDPNFVKALWAPVRNDFEGFNGVKHFETLFERGEGSAIFADQDRGNKDAETGNFNMSQIDSLGKEIPADEVIIRLSQIDEKSFKFWRSTDLQEQMSGNPFGEPMNLESNITNGLGIWEGKGAVYFKVVAKKDTIFTERYTPNIFEAF